MEYTIAPYECQFSTDERKKMVAQCMAQLRKGKGMSQKEAAALIGVSQATYSAYERGRNEPPTEILVRLSYLFDCSVDTLVQRDRLDRTTEDAQKRIDELKKQLQECEEQMVANGGNNPMAQEYLETMKAMVVQLEQITGSPEAAKSYEEPLNKA